MIEAKLFESIKAAVKLNHGGLENATDEQIKTIWGSLPEDTKVKYLQGKKLQDATNNKPEKNIQDNTGN